MGDYKYKAFISYRHLKLDKAVAVKLQKLLESYRIPKNMGSQQKWKIFRDESELPTSNDLSGDIRDALQNSEYLIVLCSKTTKESQWCMEEMSYFKELHEMRNDHIITLLVDGTPAESFPGLLCTTRREYIDENGNRVFRDTEVEPLAANIVSNSQIQALRKLNEEFLRIAAPLAGCSYDHLYNREHRRKVRRLLWIGSTVLVLLAAFGIYNRQMRNSVEEQLLLQKIENARYLTADSRRLFNEGKNLEAIRSAYQALPQEGENRPVLPETEYLLAEELGAFEQKSFMPVMSLKHDYPVEEIAYLCDGARILTRDKNTVYLWEAGTGECIARYSMEEYKFDSNGLYIPRQDIINQMTFIKPHPGWVEQYQGLFGMIDTGHEKALDEQELYVEDAECFYLCSYGKIYKVDAMTGDVKAFDESGEEWGTDSYAFLGSRLYRWVDTMGGNDRLELLGEDGDVQKTWPVGGESSKEYGFDFTGTDIVVLTDEVVWTTDTFFRDRILVHHRLSDGTILLEDSIEISLGDNSLSTSVKIADMGDGRAAVLTDGGVFHDGFLNVRLYDESTGEIFWDYTEELWVNSIDAMEILKAENTKNPMDILMVIAGNKCVLLDLETGENIHTYMFEEGILSYYYTTKGLVQLILADGEELLIAPRHMNEAEGDYFFSVYLTHAFPTEIRCVAYCNHHYAAVVDKSNYAYIFQDKNNEDFQKLFFNEDSSIAKVIVNTPNSYGLIDCHKTVYLYAFDTEEYKELYAGKDYVDAVGFIDDTTAVIEDEDGNLLFYDAADGSLIRRIDADGNTHRGYQCSKTDGKMIYKENDVIYLVDKDMPAPQKLIDAQDVYTYRVSPNFRQIVASHFNSGILIWDMESGSNSELKTKCSEDNKVEWISWKEDSSSVAFGYQDGSIEIFAAETGKKTAEISYEDCTPLCCDMKDDYIYVFCDNGAFWQMDKAGKPIKSIVLEGSGKLSGYQLELECEELSAQGLLMVSIFNESGSERWFIDLDEFEPRFFIEGCCAYLESRQAIVVAEYSEMGLYPLYSTEQLKRKAEMVLERIESEPKE